MGKRAPITIRVNPDVDAKTHAKITTGTAETKFGIAWTRARAAYARAKAQADFARDSLARQRKLLKQNLATRGDLAAARNRLAKARTDLKAQQSLGTDREQTTLRAPFSGVVAGVSVDPGARLGQGAALVTLTRSSRLLVPLGVQPDRAAALDPHARITLQPVFADKPVRKTRLDQITGTVQANTGLVDAQVRLTGKQARGFLPGMRVRATITLARHRGILVPRSAVLTDSDGAYLFVVHKGTARRIPVDIRIRTPEKVLIRGEVRAGDRVVVTGNYELRDGMAVAGAG